MGTFSRKNDCKNSEKIRNFVDYYVQTVRLAHK